MMVMAPVAVAQYMKNMQLVGSVTVARPVLLPRRQSRRVMAGHFWAITPNNLVAARLFLNLAHCRPARHLPPTPRCMRVGHRMRLIVRLANIITGLDLLPAQPDIIVMAMEQFLLTNKGAVHNVQMAALLLVGPQQRPTVLSHAQRQPQSAMER